MLERAQFLERVLSYSPGADEAMLGAAYDFAEKAHEDQKRASGEHYFTHPRAVAEILTELRLDDVTIATGLLHDTVEDTTATRAEIEDAFGNEISDLVDGVTKIAELDLVSRKAEQAENFRKLLIAISSDIRVLLVKLADRLHNMRTLQFVKHAKQQRISRETLDIYAPLAGRMGIHWLREELEDSAFRWLYPDAYETVLERLEQLRAKNQGLIEDIERQLREKLEEGGLDAKVVSREKKPYSVWRKMENKQISLEQLSDIYGFRVITRSVEDCYRVLGVIHTIWRIVPGRFKDYISVPKSNDYQSVHTTVVGPGHQRVELQIRTGEMDRIAEYGIAAHSLYKDDSLENGAKKRRGSQESNAYQWLRRHVDLLREGDNPEEFMEHTRLELFRDQVFCFTPNGRLIALPQGATPIDFAYAVHTDIGHSCVGAKVNGRHMPLVTELRNGDEVEIIRSSAQTPPAAWEKIVVTGKARAAIRRATRDAVQKQYGDLGRDILEHSFSRRESEFDQKALQSMLHRLPHNTVEEVLAAVGRGELASDEVYRAVLPDAPGGNGAEQRPVRRALKRDEKGWFGLGKTLGVKFRWPGSADAGRKGGAGGVPIRGFAGSTPVRFATEGGAIPGDRIVGIMTPGKGITIYPIHAEALQKYDDQPERWIDVTWDIDDSNTDRFPAQIIVTALNEPGSLAQIAQLIADSGGNIDNLKMLSRAHDFTKMLINLEVWDVRHLNEIISGLKSKKVVNGVEREFG